MKYKSGDKIKIKKKFEYRSEIQEMLKETNYILTIDMSLGDFVYSVIEKPSWRWDDVFIEGIYEMPIMSRFEILDL